jgi:hypothetical protein
MSLSLLVLLGNAVSFGMLTISDIEKFPEDILRHIFVVSLPSTQNQLKNSCKSWHAIGVKKAPNMYKLVEDESFNPSQSDWSYIMMNAAWDGNIEVMKNILNRTNQRNFDYDFTDAISFRLCDMPVIKELQENGVWKNDIPKKCKELDLTSNSHKQAVAHTPLFKACFIGDVDEATHELAKVVISQKNTKYYFFEPRARLDINEVNRDLKMRQNIHDCIYIATCNNNPHCIRLLSSQRNKRESDQIIHLDLLYMAMNKQKKHAFCALVKNNVFGCLNDLRLGYAFDGINTTTLDEICKQTHIPNLVEYIALYKDLGGKTLDEMGYRDDYDDIFDFPHVCSLQ